MFFSICQWISHDMSYYMKCNFVKNTYLSISNYFSSMPGIILLNILGISIVQLQPNLKAMFSSTSRVSFFLVSELMTIVLMDTFIRVFICLQENRENPPHAFPGLVQITSVTISVNVRSVIISLNKYLIGPGILFKSLLGWRTQEQGAATRTDERGLNKVSISESFFSDKFIKHREKVIPNGSLYKQNTII